MCTPYTCTPQEFNGGVPRQRLHLAIQLYSTHCHLATGILHSKISIGKMPGDNLGEARHEGLVAWRKPGCRLLLRHLYG